LKESTIEKTTESTIETTNMPAGSGRDEMPPIMIDRTGAKLTFDERYSRNSSGQYGLVVEQVNSTIHVLHTESSVGLHSCALRH